MVHATRSTPAIDDVLPGDEVAVDRVEGWFRQYAATRDPDIRERIIVAYLGLADRLADRYRGSRGATPEDLRQTARVGLVAAVDRYDPDYGNPFVPYAVACVVGELKRYLRDTSWRVHVSRPVKERSLRLCKALDELPHTLGRSPTVAELADHLGISMDETLEAIEVVHTRSEVSLDQQVGEENDAPRGAGGPPPAARPGRRPARAGARDRRPPLLPRPRPVRYRRPGRMLPDARLAPAAPRPRPHAHPTARLRGGGCMAQDAVALIKADHRQVEQLFREFEEAGDRAYKTKQKLVSEIIRELEVHAAIEEEIYYPAVEAKAKKDGKEQVAEAVEEHHVVKVLLGELRAMSAEDDAFDAKVTVLMENVRHHV